MGRGVEAVRPAAEAVRAVLGSLTASHDLTVVDVPRHLDERPAGGAVGGRSVVAGGSRRPPRSGGRARARPDAGSGRRPARVWSSAPAGRGCSTRRAWPKASAPDWYAVLGTSRGCCWPPSGATHRDGPGAARWPRWPDGCCERSGAAWTPARADRCRHDHRSRVVDLEPIRDRLAGLGRAPTPADVATAMRAEGLMVSDAVADRDRRGAAPAQRGRGPAGRAAARAWGDRRPGQRSGPGLRRPGRRAGAHRAAVRRRRRGTAAGSAAGRVGRPPAGRRGPVRRRPAGRRQPGPRRARRRWPTRAPASRSGCRRVGPFSLDDCVRVRFAAPRAAPSCCARMVAARLAFLVSGGTGSGKTTLLGALLGAGSARRADRDRGGLARAAPGAPPRRPPGGAAGQRRARGRDHPDRPGAAVTADAAGPAGGRRGPGRGRSATC